MTSPTVPDASADKCPLCGFNNTCSLSDPRTATQPCWCFSVTIDPARLEALPANLRNRACLCPRCAGIAASSATELADQIK